MVDGPSGGTPGGPPPVYGPGDSDSDGLSDAEERELGTHPQNPDTDGDGITDLGEVRGTGTDPLDPTSRPGEETFFVVLPYQGPAENRSLRFGTEIGIADVFFLVDMTGSMNEERTNLINGLVGTIIPGIQAAVADVQFGVGGLDDYPYGTYGGSGISVSGTGTTSVCLDDVCTVCVDGVCERCIFGECTPLPPGEAGLSGDLPFYLLRGIEPGMADRGGWSLDATATECPTNPDSNDVGEIVGAPNGEPDLLEAVEGLPCHNGGDHSESYVPALYATATGEGLTWPDGSIPPRDCPAVADERGQRRGYPCFRAGALPIVLLMGDASFHNGPAGAEPYDFLAPTYNETVEALRTIGARVIGIHSGSGEDRVDYETVAADTGTVRSDGTPLVFDIADDGSGLSQAVVDAVSSLVGGTPQDVTTATENVDGNPDGFDATQFIVSIRPVEGYDGAGRPGLGYDGKDDTTFFNVIPGTTVDFDVEFQNTVRPPAATAQIFKATIVVLGNGVARLDERDVFVVVPPDGSTILI